MDRTHIYEACNGVDSYPIYNAIRKYGKENFTFEVIHNLSCIEELDHFEIESIKKHNTLVPHGYNLKSGGANGKMHASTKEKLSQYSSSKASRARKILQFDQNGNFINLWNTLAEADKFIGSRGVTGACSRKFKRNGYWWRYPDDPDIVYDNICPRLMIIDKGYSNSPIAQFDITGNKIKTWKSRKDISESLTINFNKLDRAIFKKYSYENSFWVPYSNSSQFNSNKLSIVTDVNRFTPVYLYDKDRKLIQIFDYINDAAKYLSIDRRTFKKRINSNMLYCDSYWETKVSDCFKYL